VHTAETVLVHAVHNTADTALVHAVHTAAALQRVWAERLAANLGRNMNEQNVVGEFSWRYSYTIDAMKSDLARARGGTERTSLVSERY